MDFLFAMIEVITESQIQLSEGYITSSTVLSILVGIIAAAITITTAFLMKKGKVFAIITGVLQILGTFCAQKTAHLFMDLDFIVTATGGTMDEAMENLGELYLESMVKLIPYMLCNMIFMAAWIFTLVFIVKTMKLKPRVFPVFALIIHIFRYLFVGPIAGFNIFHLTDKVTESIQRETDILNYAVILIPLVLVLASAVISFVRSKKEAAAAPVIEAEAESGAEEQ